MPKNNDQAASPWLKPLAERKAEAISSLKNGKRLAILFYPNVDLGSSFRYRGYNVYTATKLSKKWQLLYFFPDELETVKELLPNSSLLIFGRFTKWSIQFDELAYAAHQQGIKVVLDLDDCVCGSRHIKEMFNVVSPDIIDQEYWIKASAELELISELADGFTVTNSYLGELLSKSHNSKPYKVIHNFLNDEQIGQAETLIAEKSKNPAFTIGYFSGSHTHATDFEVLYPELCQLLHEYPELKLRIVGLLELPKSAADLIGNGQIEFLPFTDFLSLEKLVSKVDLNIAPLADNVFANCKSELKFFEAALVETPTIASPSFAFEQTIVHGKTGFLCRPGEWYHTILKLYQNPDLAHRIATAARADVLKRYTPTASLPQIERAFDYYAS